MIRAIAEAEIAAELGRHDIEGIPFLAETAEVLERRLLGMPKHFAIGMAAMTVLFDGTTVSREGAAFHRLSVPARQRALARLRALPLGPLGNFTTFYDRMAPFIFWSHLEEHGQLDLALATERAGR